MFFIFIVQNYLISGLYYKSVGWWWRQKIHSSWVIAIACSAFVSGVAISPILFIYWCWGIAGFLVTAVCLWFRYKYLMPIIIVSAVVGGLGYGSAHLGARGAYESLIGQVATIRGKVREDPSRTSSGSTSLQLENVDIDDVAMPGSIYTSVRSSKDVKRGDIVTMRAQVREGFGNFPISVSAPAVDSVVRPVPGDTGRVVRDWFADKVRINIPEPQASLGIGFLTGQKNALPEDLSDALKIAGLTHIVVASGYNLTILVRMARRLFVKVSKFLSAVASGVMITMFMAVTGLSPSMTRAGLVSGLSLMSWYYGHSFHPLVLLPFAAAITVAINPAYVWGDLGWQLSFSAFAGVMLVAPLLQHYFFGSKEPGVFRQILGETIAAHIITVPIIALSFGTVSNVAVIANILVVPLVPLAMLLTFVCGIWAIVNIPFAWLVATPTDWLLSYMVNVATFVSELTWAQSELEVSGWVWVGYCVLLLVLGVWAWKVTKFDFRGANPIL